jgi:hydroquinone glucosyltransferase
MEARKPHLVMFPSVAGMGHFIPLSELAKLLASRHGFAITFMTAKFMVTSAQTAYTESLASSGLGIRFIELPEVEMDSEDVSGHPLVSIFNFLEKSKGSVEHVLRTLLSDSLNPISAFITDLFCTAMIEVCTSLKIPSYVLYITSASNLSVMLYHPTMDAEMKESLKDLDGSVKVPGFPSLPALDFPDPMQDKSDPLYHLFLRNSYRMFKADGILINTFQDLESRIIQALVNGELLPSIDGINMPSIYPVGPLIAPPKSVVEDPSGSLEWLDNQPASSVIFVSFGSVNFLSGGQIGELALGLEGSGHRFMWVLRSPPNASNPDVSSLLPPGFEQRTKDRGLVVTSWAPQVAILAHPSTGGFVSHCGWNSVLESIWFGVPIIAWPLQADQKPIGYFLVNDIKMAVGLQKRADGIVTKEEMEKAARELMEGEDGRKRRERANELKESAKTALAEGGSSSQALAAVVALWKANWCAQ